MRHSWRVDRSSDRGSRREPLAALLLAGVLLAPPAGAQVPWIANVSDAEDFRSVFTNPAVLSFAPPHVAVGAEVLHVGAEDEGLGLSRGHLSVASPTRMPGLGFSVRYLRTPRFSDMTLQLQAGRRLWRGLALGANAGVRQLHYDPSGFNLEIPDDPLLAIRQSKLVATLGMGAFAHIGRSLTAGLSIEDLNRPNVSLSSTSTYSQPFALHGGVKLYLGGLRVGVGARTISGRVSWIASAERWFDAERAMLRVLALSQQAAFEGQLEIRGGVALDYRFTYPWNDLRLASTGTHHVSIVARLARLPDLPPQRRLADWRHEPTPRGLVVGPAPYRPDLPRFATSIPKRPYDPEDLVALLSNPDSVLVTWYVVERRVDSLVTAEEIRSLPAFLVGMADTARCEPYEPRTEPSAVLSAAGPVDPRRVYNPEYREKLRALMQSAARDSATLPIISSPGAEQRLYEVAELARTSTNLLRLEQPVIESDADSLAWTRLRGDLEGQSTCTALSSPTIRFLLTWPQGVAWASWRLEIRDSDDELFHALSGEGPPPTELVWDWRNEYGELLAPDYYLCRLRWRTEPAGLDRSSNYRVLYVSHRRIRNLFEIAPFRSEALPAGEHRELILRP